MDPKDKQKSDDIDDRDMEDWIDAEDNDGEIIGYECLGCGNVQPSNGWGGRCDCCEGLSLEPMYN